MAKGMGHESVGIDRVIQEKRNPRKIIPAFGSRDLERLEEGSTTRPCHREALTAIEPASVQRLEPTSPFPRLM